MVFDAKAFYRAAVDGENPEAQGLPRESLPRQATFLPRPENFRPPAPPTPARDGEVSKEAVAEYIEALHRYMHNLHVQKTTAYEKLEGALKEQMDLKAEIRILKGMVGIPHYALDENKRVELVLSHYPRLELPWVESQLVGLPVQLGGGCYIIWRPSPALTTKLEVRKGFNPLCLSIREPLFDRAAGKYTRRAGAISHRYVYVVDGNAEGQWRGKQGSVAVAGAPWFSSPHVLMEKNECFESLKSFISFSPDLIKEIETYRFEYAATRPHMLQYLDEELARIRIQNEEEKPRVKELLIEDIKPLMLHHHHETTVMEDGEVVLLSKTLGTQSHLGEESSVQGTNRRVSVSSSVPPTPLSSAASNAKKAWGKIRGLSRGAQAFRESTGPVPQSPLDAGAGMVGRHDSSEQYLGQNQADDKPLWVVLGPELPLVPEEAGDEAKYSPNRWRGK